MFKKSLLASVAFGAVGLAGIVYVWRKFRTRSAGQNKADLKVVTSDRNDNLRLTGGTWGYCGKFKSTTSSKSVFKYIKGKEDICQLFRDNADLIPPLAIDKYLAMKTVQKEQLDILKEEEDYMRISDAPKNMPTQPTLKPFSAMKDEEENFKNKPKTYDIHKIVEKAWANVLMLDDLSDIELDLPNTVVKGRGSRTSYRPNTKYHWNKTAAEHRARFDPEFNKFLG